MTFNAPVIYQNAGSNWLAGPAVFTATTPAVAIYPTTGFFAAGALVVVGIVLGALLGTYAAKRLVDALDTPLIHLTRHVDASTYAWAAGMVLVVSALTLAVSWWTRRRTSAATPAAALP